jgi:3-phosphoshikimate 1-carboxyvinyltransferase
MALAMKTGIVKPPSGGIIKAIPSGTQAQKALLCSALSDSDTYVKCSEVSDDINATVKRLNSMGARMRHDGGGFEVVPIPLPLSGKLLNQINGDSGTFNLPEGVSSQQISGLLLTLPLLDGDSVIKVKGSVESKSYIEITLETMEMFGVKVKREEKGDGGTRYMVKGNQRYTTPGSVQIEGDWTTAAAWLCAAAIKGNGVICTGLDRYSRQNDKAIVDILERFGAVVAYRGDSVAVRPAFLRSIRIDAKDIPDIVPVIAAVAAATEGQTVIYNAEKLRTKENDQLGAIETVLRDIGVDAASNTDGLIIKGRPELRGGTTSSLGDHRLVMMAAIVSTACEGPVAIKNAEVISKSYPGFFDDFAKLGGKVILKM